MKTNKSIFRKLLVNGLVISLIQTQTMSIAHATMDDFAQGVNVFNQVANNINNQYQQAQNIGRSAQLQAAAAKQFAQLYTPKMTQDPMFPNCGLPAPIQSFPQNVCQPTQDRNAVSMLDGNEKGASDMVAFFDKMLNEVTQVNIGVACMTREQNKFDDQMTATINNLTRLQTQLKEESAQFSKDLNLITDNLQDQNSILMGGDDSTSVKNTTHAKTRDFNKIITDPACQNIIGSDVFSSAKSIGLNGLKQSMEGKNLASIKFKTDAGQMTQEIQAQAQKIKDSIAQNGVDNFIQNATPNIADKLTSYQGLPFILQKEQANLKTQTDRIQKSLAKLGYTNQFPQDSSLSSSLGDEIGRIVSKSESDYMSKCTSSTESGVIPYTNEELVKKIRQKATGNSPMAVQNYSAELRNILNSSDSIDSKLQQIAELEKKGFHGMSLEVMIQGSITSMTPYDYFNKAKQGCSDNYKSNHAADAKSIQALLQEYKKVTDSFGNNVSNSIVNTMINCNGESLKASDKCNEESLDPGKAASFCVAKAATCANVIGSCYGQVQQKIDDIKNKVLPNLANQYNAKVAVMIARANNLLKAQTANIEQLNALINQRFPGSAVELGKDLAITPPDLSSDKFGVPLIKNGDTASLIAALPEKIEKLQEMLANQKKAADDKMAQASGKVRDNIEKEKAKFQGLASACKNAANQSRQAIADADNKRMKELADLDKKVSKFCRKYNNLRSNPSPACDSAKGLADSMDDIAMRLSKDTQSTAMQYENYCNSLNNEAQNINFNECKNIADADRKKECQDLLDIKIANATRSGNGAQSGSSGNPAKPSKVRLADLCKDKSAKNSDFVSNLIKKLPESEKNKLPGLKDGKAINIKKITEALKNGSFEEFATEDNALKRMLDDIGYSPNESENSVCSSLYEKGGDITALEKLKKENKPANKYSENSTDVKEIHDAKVSRDEIVEKLKNPKLTDDEKATLEKSLDARNKYLKTAIDLANSNAADEDNKKIDEKIAAAKLFDEKLAEYIGVGSDTRNNKATSEWARIGEQDTGTCDAESTTQIAKNPLNFDINNFDNMHLSGGRSK